MKTKILLLIVVVATLVNSCTDDRDSEVNNSENLSVKKEKIDNNLVQRNSESDSVKVKVIGESSKELPELETEGGDPKDIPPRR